MGEEEVKYIKLMMKLPYPVSEAEALRVCFTDGITMGSTQMHHFRMAYKKFCMLSKRVRDG